MISLQSALILITIHLTYYFILQVRSDIVRMGLVKNTPNKIITKLRTEFKVNIKTFQKNNDHYGFAWFKTIYLNEKLFKSEKALRYTFYHELYHLRNNHKRNTLLFRFLFSLVPGILVFAHWAIFLIIYSSFAYFLYVVNERYEKGAWNYANQMIKDEPTINSSKRKDSN